MNLPHPDTSRLRQAAAELHNPRTLALAAMLSALNLAINQISIPVSAYLEISFDFLASAATGFLCGPWVAALSGVGTDLLGYVLRPNGPYFPGFTLSAMLLGIVYGLWYYRKPVQLWRIICCKLTVTVLFNFFLTPLWLHIMYGQAFVLLSTMRVIKNAVKFPVDVFLLLLVLKACRQYLKIRRRI